MRRQDAAADAADAAPPRPALIILSPPRSFTSVISAMLGQHPDAVALPELNLFAADTLGEWWETRESQAWKGAGLLRALAQLQHGEQTEDTVAEARRWLRRRAGWPTGRVFHMLRREVAPSLLIDTSPRTSLQPANLQRVREWAPRAQFIHLVRDPAGQARSLARLMGPDAPPAVREAAASGQAWLRHHRNIVRFLGTVPEERWLRVRGEQVLDDPGGELRRIAEWLGLRADDEAIESMQHPEDSPFAGEGPPGAKFGNDPSFLRDPALRPRSAAPPVPDPAGVEIRLAPAVAALGRELGYEAPDGAANGRAADASLVGGAADG